MSAQIVKLDCDRCGAVESVYVLDFDRHFSCEVCRAELPEMSDPYSESFVYFVPVIDDRVYISHLPDCPCVWCEIVSRN